MMQVENERLKGTNEVLQQSLNRLQSNMGDLKELVNIREKEK